VTANRPTFSAGRLDCTVVSDGELPYPPAALLGNAPADELERALAGELDENGMVVGRFNPLLIHAPDALVLVDTGIGHYAPTPGAGRLLEALAGEDIQPGDVDLVVLTHGHPDHLGGLIADGAPGFPRARHLILSAEWQFWTTAGREALPAPIQAAFDETVATLHGLGRVDVVEDSARVAPGVLLSHAPGHTPGHAIVELGDPPEALFLADAVLHEASFEHPEWTSPIDADPVVAIQTRRALLGRAADERLLIAAYHLGKHGRVERRGSSFRFVPGAS
jgi:glyoxylase-like metal-dependent hydrolase (beta-lactamase superfamily II)